MTRSIMRLIARISLIAVSCWNLRAYTHDVLSISPRDENEIVNWEKLWQPIHDELIRVGYTIGDLGYASPRALRGEPVSADESVRRVQLYYVVIPLNLVQNKLDAP